jgi:hypothetical protein
VGDISDEYWYVEREVKWSYYKKRKDPKLIQMGICDFIRYLGKDGLGLSYATISTYAGA